MLLYIGSDISAVIATFMSLSGKLSIGLTICHFAHFSASAGWREVIWVIYFRSISSNSPTILLWPLACSPTELQLAHWMFSLFRTILCTHKKWFRRRISPAHLALTLLCSPSSDARFELRLFDDWVKCFLCLHWCSDAQPEPFTLVLFTFSIQEKLMMWQRFLQALQQYEAWKWNLQSICSRWKL